MKRIFVLIVSAMLICSLMVAPVLAFSGNGSYGEVPKSADAITIDGTKDAVYDLGLKLDINRKYEPYDWSPDTGSTGVAWIIWQDGFLYIYSEINKAIGPLLSADEYNNQSGEPWMTDSLEVFLDPPNEGENSEQYRIDSTGWRSFENRFEGISSYNEDENAADGIFEGKARRIDSSNYAVEFKIPIAKGAGGDLGLLLQINEMWDDGARSVIFTSSSNGESNSWEAYEYDYIVLSANEVTAVVAAEPEPELGAGGGDPAEIPAPVVEAPAPVAPAPQTADPVSILVLGSLISAAGLVIARKRK